MIYCIVKATRSGRNILTKLYSIIVTVSWRLGD